MDKTANSKSKKSFLAKIEEYYIEKYIIYFKKKNLQNRNI